MVCIRSMKNKELNAILSCLIEEGLSLTEASRLASLVYEEGAKQNWDPEEQVARTLNAANLLGSALLQSDEKKRTKLFENRDRISSRERLRNFLPPQQGIPNLFFPFEQTCSPTGWRIQGNKYVGGGSFGDVFRACKGNNCKYVAKIIHYAPSFMEDIENEKNYMYILGNRGLSPKLDHAILCNDWEELKKLIDDYEQAKQPLESRRDAERESEQKELFESPNYAILFSDFVPQGNPSIEDLKSEEFKEALTNFLTQFAKLGLEPDTISGNILPYQDPHKKWKMKLVDTGEMSRKSSGYSISQQKINNTLRGIASHFGFPHKPEDFS